MSVSIEVKPENKVEMSEVKTNNYSNVFESERNQEKIAEIICELINKNRVLLFSKTWCPFCLEVKRTLNELLIPFNFIELDSLKNGSIIHKELIKITNQKTVPSIFIDGEHIGGCNDFKSSLKDKKWDKLIAEFGDKNKNIKQMEKDLYYDSKNNTIKNDKNKAIQCLFLFPSTVNGHTIQCVAMMTVIISIFGVIFRNNNIMKWCIFGLFIDFCIRFFSGASMSPLGIIANIIVSQKKPRFGPGAPKQFASFCGVIFTGITFLCYAYDETIIGCIILSILLVFAAMEGFLNFCVGCYFFGFLVKYNIVSATIYKLHINTKDEKEYMWNEAFTKLNEGPYKSGETRFYDTENPRQCDLYYKIKTDEQKQEDFHLIRHIRISIFQMILGIVALSLTWRMLADINLKPFDYITYDLTDILFCISFILFVIATLLYLAKITFYFKKVVKEFQNPAMINGFAAIPMNIMAFCYLLRDTNDTTGIKTVFWICAFSVLVLLIHVIQIWIQRRLSIENIDPSWLMLPIANFLTVFIGISLDINYNNELWLWFSSGLILFFILFPLTFYKIIVTSNSDDRQRNNLLIWCALPTGAGLAFEAIESDNNNLSLFMYWASIFFSLIMFQLMFVKFIGRARFDASYYSFGFSFCLVAISSIKINLYVGNKEFYQIISYIYITIACLAVCVNVLHTIFSLCQKRIFRPIIPKWAVLSFMKLTHEAIHSWIRHMSELINNNDEIDIDRITAEFNIYNIIHNTHAKHEDDIIFREAKILFPDAVKTVDNDHERIDEMMTNIDKILKKKDDKEMQNILIKQEMNNFLKELSRHLIWEESHMNPVLKKNITLKLQKIILQKIWDSTEYSKWLIFIPWVLRNQSKFPQRILFLKTLLWSMPWRCQMIGLIVYRGCNDVLWTDISKELPEIIPRGVSGWRRQYS